MTATPKETKYVSNTVYFGDPVYTYSLKQGIELPMALAQVYDRAFRQIERRQGSPMRSRRLTRATGRLRIATPLSSSSSAICGCSQGFTLCGVTRTY